MSDFMFDFLSEAVPPASGLLGIELFGGGSGWGIGARMAGIEVVATVENDPKEKCFSDAFEAIHSHNLGKYGGKFFRATVQEMQSRRWEGIPRNAFIANASPVCSNFSRLAQINGKKEDEADITAAIAVADAIKCLNVNYWCLEQVPNYSLSQSYCIIYSALVEAGYLINSQVVDFGEWGVIPQDRKRLLILASKRGLQTMKFPPRLRQWSWGLCLTGLKLKEDEGEIPAWESEFIAQLNKQEIVLGVIVDRHFSRKKGVKYRLINDKLWTVTKSCWHDDKGGSRYFPYHLWIGGKYYHPSSRFIARVCGFPDWVKLPNLPKHWGAMLGYAVPPSWSYHLITSNFW